jgi:hypothetical protein
MELVKDWWHILVGATFGLMWLSRLEWRGLNNEREIKRLWEQRKEDLANAAAARKETSEVLKEIRQDIKLLLVRENKL